MSDWFVSSAVYATIPVWVGSHAYSIGDLVKPTAPAVGKEYVFRVTTAGTSGTTEPTWPANNAATVTGGATFTNVSGQSTYGWSAAAGTLYCLCTANRTAASAAGDRIFVSSDHSENAGITYSFLSALAFGLIQVISVNRAGSVPPVEANIQSGASITATMSGVQQFALEAFCEMFWQGITFTLAGTATGASIISLNNNARRAHYFKNCAFVWTVTAGNGNGLCLNSSNKGSVTLDNTTVQFALIGASGGSIGPIGSATFDFNWINTPNAIVGAVIPTTLFAATSAGSLLATCRGVDLSAITNTLLSATSPNASKLLLESCKIASAVTRLSTANTATSTVDTELELVNCYDGTNVLNERHTFAGDITVDRSTYMTGGAQDDGGAYSLKHISSSRSDLLVFPLDSFWFDVEGSAIGSSKTATVEIAGASALNNTDIHLLLEYQGTSGSPVASFVDTLSSALATSAALPTSSKTWTSSLFASWNPSDLSAVTLSNSNLTATTTGVNCGVRANVGKNGGKYYWEYTMTAEVGTAVGVSLASATLFSAGGTQVGTSVVTKNGTIFSNGVNSGSSLGLIGNGQIVCVAVDFTAALIWFRLGAAGNWNGSGTANPATGAGGVSISALVGTLFPTMGASANGDVVTANFGASAFSGAVPSGFTPGVPAADIKQYLQAFFTPQAAGRVRGLVRLGKVSTTVYVNPQIAIT